VRARCGSYRGASESEGIDSAVARILDVSAFLSSEADLALALTKALPCEGSLSVQSLPVREFSPASATAVQPAEDVNASFDARWAAWIERGRQHDLAVKRKVRIASIAAAVIGLLTAAFFGLTAGAR
jgi:hypothetical protein